MIDFCEHLGEDYRVDSILTQIMPCIQVCNIDSNDGLLFCVIFVSN